jgi:4-hydroxyphenylacetate 3-monooxygenase
MVKLRFLAGLARRIADTNGTLGYPQVREMLGQIAANVGQVEGLVWGMEARGCMTGGYLVPDRALLYAAQVKAQEMYPQLIAKRELAGGGMIMLPSSIADYGDADTAGLIRRTQLSPYYEADDRAVLRWRGTVGSNSRLDTCARNDGAGTSYVGHTHAFRVRLNNACGMVDAAMRNDTVVCGARRVSPPCGGMHCAFPPYARCWGRKPSRKAV